MPRQETNDGILMADFHVKHMEAVGGPLFSCMSVLLEPTGWFMMCHGLFFGNDAECPLNEA